jgi:hypothetical protein
MRHFKVKSCISHDIAEILLKLALNTNQSSKHVFVLIKVY